MPFFKKKTKFELKLILSLSGYNKLIFLLNIFLLQIIDVTFKKPFVNVKVFEKYREIQDGCLILIIRRHNRT